MDGGDLEFGNSPVKVYVGWPSLGMNHSEFTQSLVGLALCQHVLPEGCPVFDTLIHWRRDSNISNLREAMAQEALRKGATHLLMIDSDQTFPPWIVQKWLMAEKPVIAANVATKKLGASYPTARAYEEGNKRGRLIYTEEDSKGLEQVWRVGTGIMMVETSVLKRIPEPWFPTEWVPETSSFRGEDWGFAKKCEEYSIPIFIDHDVSEQVGHCGEVVFTHGFTRGTRRMVERAKQEKA